MGYSHDQWMEDQWQQAYEDEGCLRLQAQQEKLESEEGFMCFIDDYAIFEGDYKDAKPADYLEGWEHTAYPLGHSWFDSDGDERYKVDRFVAIIIDYSDVIIYDKDNNYFYETDGTQIDEDGINEFLVPNYCDGEDLHRIYYDEDLVKPIPGYEGERIKIGESKFVNHAYWKLGELTIDGLVMNATSLAYNLCDEDYYRKQGFKYSECIILEHYLTALRLIDAAFTLHRGSLITRNKVINLNPLKETILNINSNMIPAQLRIIGETK